MSRGLPLYEQIERLSDARTLADLIQRLQPILREIEYATATGDSAILDTREDWQVGCTQDLYGEIAAESRTSAQGAHHKGQARPPPAREPPRRDPRFAERESGRPPRRPESTPHSADFSRRPEAAHYAPRGGAPPHLVRGNELAPALQAILRGGYSSRADQEELFSGAFDR